MIDPAIKGKVLGTVRFPLDRSKLGELARALHDDDPAWHDSEVAAAAGLDGVPAPPTTTVLADHWRKQGALEPAIEIGMDLPRVLHGEAAWEYLMPVRLGDELTAATIVTDVATRAGKRGGTMTFVTLETTFTNQRGELAVRQRNTLIETGARA